jgi:hypothetical protein
MAWRQLAYYRFSITEYSSGLVESWNRFLKPPAAVFTPTLYTYWVSCSVFSPSQLTSINRNAGSSVPLRLTLKSRASYIQDGRTATFQMLHFIYIFFNKCKYWVF